MKPQHYPITLAMAVAVLLNLAVVRLGHTALSEGELVAASVAIQAGAGMISQLWTRSKASLAEERPPRSGGGGPG